MALISIRDVGPRDGLQNEEPIDPQSRAWLATALADAGLKEVEVASFVSPKAVPSMSEAAEVVKALPQRQDVIWWALVPNAKGAELALDAGIRCITVTVSASEGYSQKNVGSSTAAAIAMLGVIQRVVGNQAELDVVVSCVFGSPFGDVINPAPALVVVDAVLASMPTARLTLADTTGTATPRRIETVLSAIPDRAHQDLGLHLHDNRGTALANALAAIDLGITRFDSATGGLGGSPFAPGAGGNLATEDLVLMLNDLGHETGVDLSGLLEVSKGIARLVGHDLPSRVSAAGALPIFQDR